MAALERKRKRPVPLIGRGGTMKRVKETVKNLVSAYCSGDEENAVSFITFEGGSGIGKTRCLQELKEQVPRYCTPADSQLKCLYEAGAVHQISITFTGRGFYHSHPAEQNIAMDGGKFLEVTILSDLLHGMPFFKLDSETQQSISSSSSFGDAMRKVSGFLKQGKSGVVLLYLLLDEMQLLAALVGLMFVKEMCDAVGRFMKDSCTAGESDLILVPCLAGCKVPEVASQWPRDVHQLVGLSFEESKEVIGSSTASRVMQHEQLDVLLQDCMGVPRFLEWVSAGLRDAGEIPGLGELEMIHVARKRMVNAMESWAKGVIDFGGSNLEHIKDAFRYCLIQGAVEDSEITMEERIRGYLYWKEEGGRIVFDAPIVLLHYVGERLNAHQPLVQLRPDLLQGETLERACLEMVYVRLCLARGKVVKLDNLFPGCTSINPIQVRVPDKVSREDEAFQFITPSRSGGRHFATLNDASTRLVPVGLELGARTAALPLEGVVMKTKSGCPVVDGRVFLRGEAGEMFELWIRCKDGHQVSMPDVTKWCDEAFDAALEAGRRKVYILLLPYQSFDSQLLDQMQLGLGRQVLLLDAAGCHTFMPRFFDRCVKRDVVTFFSTN